MTSPLPRLTPALPPLGSALLLPRCENPLPIKCTCRHSANRYDYTRTFTVGCGRLSCTACAAMWRRNVRAQISHGANAFPELYFLTLTIQDLPDNPNESQPQMLERLLHCWRTFAKNYLRRHYSRFPFFRVIEAGSLHNRPHIHLITPEPVPTCAKASKYPSLNAWQSTLSPDAVAFQRTLVSAGLGRIYHAERLRYGAAGAVSYLGKYLAKSTSKMLKRPDGRQVRIAESSRSWPSLSKIPTYLVGNIKPDRSAVPCGWNCECKDTSTPRSMHYQNRMALKRWMAPLDLDDVFCRTFISDYVHHKRRYYYRSKLPPSWRGAVYSATRPDLVLQQLPESLRPVYSEARKHYDAMGKNLGLLRSQYRYHDPLHLLEYLYRNEFQTPRLYDH